MAGRSLFGDCRQEVRRSLLSSGATPVRRCRLTKCAPITVMRKEGRRVVHEASLRFYQVWREPGLCDGSRGQR